MRRQRSPLLLSLLSLALLAGCKQDAAPSADTAASNMPAAMDQVAQDAADAGALPSGDAPLQPGQSEQGAIEADIGNGTQRFRSLSTKVADDIAEQVDDKLDTGKGRKAIDDANRKLEQLGTGTKMDADSVRDIVGGMAGKTFHDASVTKVDIIKTLQANLSGKSGDGDQLTISLDFNEADLSFNDASLTYRPKVKSMFDFYESKDVQVTIERFDRNADGSYALAGSFTAKDIPASNLAKELKGKVLASASGRFDYAALPLKELPKFGR